MAYCDYEEKVGLILILVGSGVDKQLTALKMHCESVRS
jgi:hypothetical protein